MKTCIVSINSKFIHSALAPWYLLAGIREYATAKQEVLVQEFTINRDWTEVLTTLIGEDADVYAFCTYIWNVEYVRRLLPALKTARPQSIIILGGPEVSFCPQKMLSETVADYISVGEGEESLPKLLDALENGDCFETIPGICFHKNGESVYNPPMPLTHFPPDPYSEEYFAALDNRIAYIEGSRGCPFSCAFCLSGRDDRLRLFPLERVKTDILRLARSGAKTIKFVDRTFNCHKQRAEAIISFILEEYGKSIPKGVCFHFEVAADLFDDETIALLATAPKGLFQVEAGLQSFHLTTLEAVTRKTNLKRLCENVKKILEPGNIHLHIDLIAGLPEENLDIFERSFNAAYALKPHMLQLGFLKLLHGSRLREAIEENGYTYGEQAPYEITSSKWLKAEEIALLHRLEDVLERLYNSGRFLLTLQYILRVTALTPFAVFSHIAEYLHSNAIKTDGISLDVYTTHVFHALCMLPNVHAETLKDQLSCDSLCSKQLNRLPDFLQQSDRRISKIKRRLAENGIKYGVCLLRSQENKVAIVKYTDRDPVTNRYALTIVSLSDFEL